MSHFMMMEPTNQTFQELIGNGFKYTVPRFQRDYAWEDQQWEELWADIESLPQEHYHYMGYIVVQRKGQHDFEIIDGQQRLVTLSLIILAAMNQIKKLAEQTKDEKEREDNLERLKLLTDRFIGAKNPVSLRVDNKLSLNRNNGSCFKSICSNLEAPNRRGMPLTNKLLSKAFEFFLKKEMGGTGYEIAQFIEKLTSGMVFTKIVVQDDLNAYKVFETLNARGVQLSTPDLLKNYIFSVVTRNDDIPDPELEDLDARWSGIIDQLGENNFTEFVRYHHNFQNKLTTKKALFASIREQYTTPTAAYSYLDSLEVYAPIYASLLNPYDEWWQNQEKNYSDVQKYLEGFDLFGIKQPLTILMIGFKQFSSEEFVLLAKYLYFLSIRYNVICHRSPSEQEQLYNQIAVKIFDGTYKRASHIKNGDEFKKLYPKNEEFRNAFAFHKMPSRQSSKKIRFLLAEIECYLGHRSDYTQTVLEHICPYNPEQGWQGYFGQGVNDVQDRLGNVILLEKDTLLRSAFAEKKKFYAQTPYLLAQKVSEYAEWNLQNVNHYQRWLAEQAVSTWTIDIKE